MPKPITPLVGCDVFISDSSGRVLLIRRSDNGLWALPGGCQNLGETPAECAVRECREESGFEVELTRLLGVYSSARYPYVNYPWKDNEFCHILYQGRVTGGCARGSDESLAVEWFAENALPALSDGHAPRIRHGFEFLRTPGIAPYFE